MRQWSIYPCNKNVYKLLNNTNIIAIWCTFYLWNYYTKHNSIKNKLIVLGKKLKGLLKVLKVESYKFKHFIHFHSCLNWITFTSNFHKIPSLLITKTHGDFFPLTLLHPSKLPISHHKIEFYDEQYNARHIKKKVLY